MPVAEPLTKYQVARKERELGKTFLIFFKKLVDLCYIYNTLSFIVIN